jgi:hypothetical protein
MCASLCYARLYTNFWLNINYIIHFMYIPKISVTFNPRVKILSRGKCVYEIFTSSSAFVRVVHFGAVNEIRNK